MRAAWLTDIHLNFLESREIDRFLESVRQADADVALLGGDIGEADSLLRFLERIERALAKPVYFVLGNHDYYGGSIESVRSEIRSFVQGTRYLVWLNTESVISLIPRTALIGHDSWPDGRIGDYAGSSVELNDFYLIEELIGRSKADRLERMQALGDEAAAHFRRVLPVALRDHDEIIALTHVPPFREAAWHEGEISADDWLPFFSCGAVGEVLVAAMRDNPSARLTVLCGHTHGHGACEILPNLSVLTGGATYGSPEIQAILELQ